MISFVEFVPKELSTNTNVLCRIGRFATFSNGFQMQDFEVTQNNK